ncbi:MAG TPA: hypothetical protein VHO25_02600 [Polyangiaceae bacterium]|nr:hypothetical protein [Polyangiaceae bacterium]
MVLGRRVVVFSAFAMACSANDDSTSEYWTSQGSNTGGQGVVPDQPEPEQLGPDLGTEPPEPVLGDLSDLQVSPPLSPLLPQGATLAGLAITPSGEYYVLDVHSGLYHLTAGSQAGTTAELVFDTRDLELRYDVNPGLQLTDVASMDDDRFLVTAANDGYLLDLQQDWFSSYFCYLPDISEEPTEYISISQSMQAEGVAVEQRTESVAYNPQTKALFAQPRTVRLDTQQVVGSEVFMFDYAGGEPVLVIGLEQNFLAGGMVTDGESLLLGRGNQLYRSTLDQGYSLILSLDAEVRIVGMARDPSGSIVLLDANTSTLITLNVSQSP